MIFLFFFFFLSFTDSLSMKSVIVYKTNQETNESQVSIMSVVVRLMKFTAVLYWLRTTVCSVKGYGCLLQYWNHLTFFLFFFILIL